jgi:hypothetical protein
MRVSFTFFLTILALSYLEGCYPKGPEQYTDFDLVYTNYASDSSFQDRKTFALPDSIVKITGDVLTNPDSRPEMMSDVYATPILNQLKQNMMSYGWTEVDKNASPDVILLVSSTTTTNLYYYYDWGYWGWYYPGYYPGWGWYYPGYYPPYVTSFQTGSLFVQMVDVLPSPIPNDGNVPVLWHCILNGLTEGSTSAVLSRVQASINQAFIQSPYLKH